MSNNNYQFLVCQDADSDAISLWEFDPENPRLVTKRKTSASASIEKGSHVAQVGNYALVWRPLNDHDQYEFQLLEFDPNQSNPFGSVRNGKS